MNEEDFNLRISAINSAIGIMSGENFEGANAETALSIMERVYSFLSKAKAGPPQGGHVISLDLGS